MRTGRVLPGSVPLPGLRLASQMAPCSIRGTLDRGELGVDLHALGAHLERGALETIAPLRVREGTIHGEDSPPDVLGTRDIEFRRTVIHFAQQFIGKPHGDAVHGVPQIVLRSGILRPARMSVNAPDVRHAHAWYRAG